MSAWPCPDHPEFRIGCAECGAIASAEELRPSSCPICGRPGAVDPRIGVCTECFVAEVRWREGRCPRCGSICVHEMPRGRRFCRNCAFLGTTEELAFRMVCRYTDGGWEVS